MKGILVYGKKSNTRSYLVLAVVYVVLAFLIIGSFLSDRALLAIFLGFASSVSMAYVCYKNWSMLAKPVRIEEEAPRMTIRYKEGSEGFCHFESLDEE